MLEITPRDYNYNGQVQVCTFRHRRAIINPDVHLSRYTIVLLEIYAKRSTQSTFLVTTLSGNKMFCLLLNRMMTLQMEKVYKRSVTELKVLKINVKYRLVFQFCVCVRV